MQPQPRTDRELLEAWRDGDRRAGEALLARHWRGLSGFFIRKLGPQCEDLIQETFIACAEGLHHYRGDASFRTYLYSVARHKLLRHMRHRARDEKYFGSGTLSVADSVRSCASLLDAEQRRGQLLCALQQLPLDTQVMLELHYWQGLSMQEIAAVVELPVNTVKSRLRRGRMRLAKTLELGGTQR